MAHGAFNVFVVTLFFYQAGLGLKIRRLRKSGRPPEVKPTRQHRGLGPRLVILGLFGFVSGPLITLSHHERLLKYPLHLALGTTIAVLITATYFVSKKIKGPDSLWRTPHFFLRQCSTFLLHSADFSRTDNFFQQSCSLVLVFTHLRLCAIV
ncbi:MAG: DUF4079 family protein [Nitrospirota bacterium]